MRLLTLNIWNYNPPWKQRREIIADIIRRENPDVVALQETRHDFRFEDGRGQGEQLADRTGFHLTSFVAHVYWRYPRIDEGLSILTHEPPLRVMSHRLGRRNGDGNHRVVLGVTLMGESGDVNAFDTHFALDEATRLSNAARARAYIEAETGDRPAILMGDLNAELLAPSIRYLVSPDDADAVPVFRDLWLDLHSSEAGNTYSAWNPVRRIDYVLAHEAPTPLSAKMVGNEAVDGVFASDHLGILVEIPM